jgi:hypothetical protein
MLASVMRWPEWLPTVDAVKALDSDELRLGARFEVFQPKLRPATWTVTQVDPGAAFTWESRNPLGRTIAGHVLRGRDDGTTELLLTVSFAGFLSPVVALLAGSLTQSYIDREAAAFAATVTAESSLEVWPHWKSLRSDQPRGS